MVATLVIVAVASVVAVKFAVSEGLLSRGTVGGGMRVTVLKGRKAKLVSFRK